MKNFYKDSFIIGIDNIKDSKPIENYPLPKKCVFVFGEESNGISIDMQKVCDVILKITQYGSTRSINVGAAAAITMYAWCTTNINA
jgi:tRNA G18 (ribose-2'-O)-methylase SpoU